jgi:hypothetical protein
MTHSEAAQPAEHSKLDEAAKQEVIDRVLSDEKWYGRGVNGIPGSIKSNIVFNTQEGDVWEASVFKQVAVGTARGFVCERLS